MAEPRRSSRQRSLVEMLAPPKRKAGDGDGELDAPAARSKRVTMGVKAEDSIKDEETSAARSADVKHEDASAPGSSSTPALDAPLVPVTRREFVKRYRVEGLGGAEVYYMPDWIDEATAERWRIELDALPQWYRPHLTVYGRTIQQSRHIAAFSTAPGLPLKYSGHPVEMHSPFPPLLADIAAQLATPECLGADVHFNHAMLNRYEDGSVYIGKHSDNVENQVIVTVSLGAPRLWIMRERAPRGAKKDAAANDELLEKRWRLASGSVLVMQGDVQRRFTHEIPREPKKSAGWERPRISITFRQLVYPETASKR